MTDITTHLFNPICIHHSNIPVKQSWFDFAVSANYQRNSLNNTSFTDSSILNQLPDLKEAINVNFTDWIYNFFYLSKACVFKFDGAWINRHSPGDWAQHHNHAGFDYSGVYYLDVPPNSGDIDFKIDTFNTNFFRGKLPILEEETLNNSNSCSVSIETGDLLIFPSFLNHSVPPNKSNKYRYSLAFDLRIDTNGLSNA